MKYTLAITHYNRFDLLLQSFQHVLTDDRIDEILILDDCSDMPVQHRVALLEKLNPKIRVIVQVKNRGMHVNKKDAVALSKNPWVILFDSDNVITTDYLDAIPALLNVHTIYCPDFARPHFDYTSLAGDIFSSRRKPNLNDAVQSCLMNTCNYLVHRDSYVDTWKHNESVRGVDTLWFNFLWMKAGYIFRVVKGMQYDHLVHEGSEFMKHVQYNMQQAKHFQKLIDSL